MKISCNTTPVVFQPITVSITIQSEEERKLLRKFFHLNESIPKLLKEKDNTIKEEDTHKISAFMRQMLAFI